MIYINTNMLVLLVLQVLYSTNINLSMTHNFPSYFGKHHFFKPRFCIFSPDIKSAQDAHYISFVCWRVRFYQPTDAISDESQKSIISFILFIALILECYIKILTFQGGRFIR